MTDSTQAAQAAPCRGTARMQERQLMKRRAMAAGVSETVFERLQPGYAGNCPPSRRR